MVHTWTIASEPVLLLSTFTSLPWMLDRKLTDYWHIYNISMGVLRVVGSCWHCFWSKYRARILYIFKISNCFSICTQLHDYSQSWIVYNCKIFNVVLDMFTFQIFKNPLSITMVHLIVKFVMASCIRRMWSYCTGKERTTLPWSMNIKNVAPPGNTLLL